MSAEACHHPGMEVPMIRTQVQLTEEQVGALRRLAAQRGVSLAELVRQGVERLLVESEEAERWQRASELVGRYRDEASDLSVNHDRYLDEAYGHCPSS
jgi:hypothetical protein